MVQCPSWEKESPTREEEFSTYMEMLPLGEVDTGIPFEPAQSSVCDFS
jgi:hypothetical protein